MERKPSATEIADRARLLRNRAPAKPIRDSRIDNVGKIPAFKPPRPDNTYVGIAPPGPGNKRPPPLPSQLLSEPPSGPSFPDSEPPTDPNARLSQAELEAFNAWRRSKAAPVEQTPPTSGRNASLVPAKVSQEELDAARARMKSKEPPAWVIQIAKWLAAPLLALLTSYGYYLQAQTQLVREEAARVKAEAEAKKADDAAVRARVSDLESDNATVRARLQDAQEALKKGVQAPLEINPPKRQRSPK